MISRRQLLVALALVPISVVAVSGRYKCIAITNLPKLPVTRASGRVSSGNLLRVVQLAGVADTWKPTRREIGSVQAGTMVEVLEDWIVVEAPDIVWVSRPIEEMKLREGDTIRRYARRGEGWADLWANGCWYKQANADFMVEPDGAGCGGDRYSAKVTEMGSQMWWFHIELPHGKTGWTLSQCLDLSAGG
jgi:hypothetical protein